MTGAFRFITHGGEQFNAIVRRYGGRYYVQFFRLDGTAWYGRKRDPWIPLKKARLFGFFVDLYPDPMQLRNALAFVGQIAGRDELPPLPDRGELYQPYFERIAGHPSGGEWRGHSKPVDSDGSERTGRELSVERFSGSVAKCTDQSQRPTGHSETNGHHLVVGSNGAHRG